MRLPGVEPGSIAWKAIILTVGLQTPVEIMRIKINKLINTFLSYFFYVFICFLFFNNEWKAYKSLFPTWKIRIKGV